MGNQRGSVMLIGLILSVCVAVVSGSFLWFLVSQSRQQSRARLQEDVSNLSVTVKMLFSEPANCQQNLSAAGWGTTLQELKDRSQNGSLKLLYPTQGPVTGIFLAPGQTNSNKNNLKSLQFSNISQLRAPQSAYRADLSFSIVDAAGLPMRAVSVPFYIVTDAAGAMVSCFTTSYPFANSANPSMQKVTMEDFLCSQLNGGDYEYVPAGQTCLLKPNIVGGN